jgi:uncharacterized C2H2 Zn-finger protein
MSKESLGNCPDCGQAYRDPNDVMPLSEPGDDVEFKTVPWAEYAAQTPEEFECPVQREREIVEGLTEALRYFGVADLMTKVSEIMRADEHNSEYIWGDGNRWLKREQAKAAERGGNCAECGESLLVPDLIEQANQDAELLAGAQPLLGRVGQNGESVFTCPSDGTWLGELIADGVMVVRCDACQKLYKLAKGKIDE